MAESVIWPITLGRCGPLGPSKPSAYTLCAACGIS